METSWVGPVVGVIVGFGLNAAYQWFREVRSRPVLKIDCDDAPRKKGENPDGVYMKFRVQNKRPRSVARNCRAYLIGINEVRGSQVMPEDLKPDSVQLPWEGGDYEPRDIPFGHSQYADIVHFSKEKSGWEFSTKPNVVVDRNPKIRDHRGTYQFTVLVAGDDVTPDTKRINVEYNGDWHNARPFEARP
jgi:hypothetical protein